jgi:hypothetical protein
MTRKVGEIWDSNFAIVRLNQWEDEGEMEVDYIDD